VDINFDLSINLKVDIWWDLHKVLQYIPIPYFIALKISKMNFLEWISQVLIVDAWRESCSQMFLKTSLFGHQLCAIVRGLICSNESNAQAEFPYILRFLYISILLLLWTSTTSFSTAVIVGTHRLRTIAIVYCARILLINCAGQKETSLYVCQQNLILEPRFKTI
jgi:hypothetical protein